MFKNNTVSQTIGDSLVTVKEACRIMEIGKTLAWQLIRLEQLEVVRIGRRCTRIKLSSIKRLINGDV